MTRSSGRGASPQIKTLPKDPGAAFTDTLRRGASKLAEQGRLLWLLGEGLSAALALQAKGGRLPDEDMLVAQITKWVQDPKAGPLQLEPHAGAAPSRSAQKKPDQEPRPRPALALDSCSLSGIYCPVVWIGSRELGSRLWSSMALGVGTDGFRRVLGWRTGSVREQAVSEGFVEDLVARGLDVREGVLVVTDGCRALDRALNQVWKGRAHIAHCRARLRNEVLRHVPENDVAAVQSQLEAAWSMAPESASGLLRDLEEKLASSSPGASERLGRSIDACLQVARLGVPAPLRERLESAGTLRMAFKNSLRWSPPEAGNRALTVGISVWLKRSRRLVGWQKLELLALTLRNLHNGARNDAAPQI